MRLSRSYNTTTKEINTSLLSIVSYNHSTYKMYLLDTDNAQIAGQTVEPLYDGHLVDRGKWPLWGGRGHNYDKINVFFRGGGHFWFEMMLIVCDTIKIHINKQQPKINVPKKNVKKTK